MNLEKMFDKYADLVIKCALKIKAGDILVIRSPIEASSLTENLVKKAYEEGAKKVQVDYSDENITKLKYIYESEETLSQVPEFLIEKENYFINKKAKYLSITGGNPELFKGIDSSKIKAANVANGISFKDFSEKLMSNYTSWCVIGAATKAWAAKVFPYLDEDEAKLKLWEEIFYTVRLFDDDPVESMNKHIENLDKYAEFLNKNNFRYLHYKSKKGTDLIVELPKGYIFVGSEEKNSFGEDFVANVPSEEVFSLPHKYGVNGIVYNTKPLNHSGVIVDKFYLKFKDGKVIDFDAEVGLDELKNILSSAKDSDRLGEIALVPYDSPISKRNILFFNTLYDENASCHFALGKAYPTCLKGGENIDEKDYDKYGINDSIVHVDFMVGDESTQITGQRWDGTTVKIFKDGNFAI